MKLYGASFCQKCKAIEKNLIDLNIKFEKIDATTLSQSELEEKHISQIPTLEFAAGKIFYVGDMSKSKLQKLIGEQE